MSTTQVTATLHDSISQTEVDAYVDGLRDAYGTGARDPLDPSVAVVDGAGVSIRVISGQLVASDGEAWYRRERSWHRADRSLRRLVVLADSGSLSLSALQWCRATDTTAVVLGDDEMLLAEGPVGRVDGRLLRVQAAPSPELSLAAARGLLRAKLDSQAEVTADLLKAPATANAISSLCDTLDVATSLDALNQLEGAAGSLYFAEWVDNPATALRWARRDEPKVPPRWRSFGGRRSPLVGGTDNRKAADPVNALLNLAYLLAAVEARLAVVALGLHPALGFFHADGPHNDPLAWDLVEVIRPEVDRYVLGLATSRVFTRRDFSEHSDGTVGIAPALRADVASQMPAWARAVAPHAEALRQLLGQAIVGKFTPTTPLSSRARRTAVVQVKERKGYRELAPGPQRAAPRQGPRFCATCGHPVARTAAGHWPKHCAECQGEARQQAVHKATVGQKGTQHLWAPDAVAKRAKSTALRHMAQAAWEAEHPGPRPDPSLFEPIRVALQGQSVRGISRRCDLSPGATSTMLRGTWIPHPRHWGLLAMVAGLEDPTITVQPRKESNQ